MLLNRPMMQVGEDHFSLLYFGFIFSQNTVPMTEVPIRYMVNLRGKETQRDRETILRILSYQRKKLKICSVPSLKFQIQIQNL